MAFQKVELQFQTYSTGATLKPTIDQNGTLESLTISPRTGTLSGGSTPAWVATAKAIFLTRLALKIGRTSVFDADVHMLRQLQSIFGKGVAPTNGVAWNPPAGYGVPISGVDPVLELTFNVTGTLTTGSPTGFGTSGVYPVANLSDRAPIGAFSAVQRDITFAGAATKRIDITPSGKLVGLLIYDTVGMSNLAKVNLKLNGVTDVVNLDGLEIYDDAENALGQALVSAYYGYVDLSDMTLNGINLDKLKSCALDIEALAASTTSVIPVKVMN